MFYEKIICPKNKWACKTAKKPNILLVTYKRMLYGSKHLIENHTSQWQAPALAQIIHSGFFYCRLGWEIWQTCLLAHVVQVCGFWSTHLDSNFISTVNNLRSCMAVVPKLWYDGLQGGTRDPSVLLRQKKTFCFYFSGSANKFLHFCVLPLLILKNGHYSFSQTFCSCRICVKSALPNFWSNDIG